MIITKRIGFDYGHRVPYHKSKCSSPHGHRSTLEVTLEGDINPVRGESDDGMVLDFSDVKRIATELIADRWDHAFLIWEEDTILLDALDNHGWKIDVLSCVPTAENLAQYAFDILAKAYYELYKDKLKLKRVRFYETPNSWADAE